MKKGIIVGESKLYDCPNDDFYMVFCKECEKIINVRKKDLKEIILCLCGKKIQLNKKEIKDVKS